MIPENGRFSPVVRPQFKLPSQLSFNIFDQTALTMMNIVRIPGKQIILRKRKPISLPGTYLVLFLI